MAEKVLVLGASLKPERYSNIALNMLLDYGHNVVAIGNRIGEIRGVQIVRTKDVHSDVDTVTLYLNPSNQEVFKEYIISLKPNRVIFNPGTENEPFMNELAAANIYSEVACTLVLLRSNQYEFAQS